MNLETFQTHAGGLLDRLRIELVLRDVPGAATMSKSSELTLAACAHGDLCNPDEAKRTGGINDFDIVLQKFSTDMYNLLMNFAIRSLPPQYDQLAMVMRNAPEETPPKA